MRIAAAVIVTRIEMSQVPADITSKECPEITICHPNKSSTGLVRLMKD
jgi:hypothetical protein